MPTKVLLLGATGYLGGSVLASLAKSYPEATFTALVRTSSTLYFDPVVAFFKQANADVTSDAVVRPSSHVDKIREAGGDPVIGSLDDYELITDLSSKADIVINAADSDSVGLLDALLEGQRRRKAEGRGVGSIIQTSGCGIFLDLVQDSEHDIRSLATSMSHGQVDVPLMSASEDGDVNSFVICPSAIYGTGSGPVKRDSLFFRIFVREIMQCKRAYYVGDGSNKYEFVHIHDLLSIFDKVFKLALGALSTPLLTSPYARHYIASTTSMTWRESSQCFRRELYKKGFVDRSEPSSVSYEDAGPFALTISSNMTTRPIRALELGWKPKYSTLSEESFVEKIEAALRVLI